MTISTSPTASTGADDDEGCEPSVSTASITNPLTSEEEGSDGCCLGEASLPNPAGRLWLLAALSPLERDFCLEDDELGGELLDAPSELLEVPEGSTPCMYSLSARFPHV